ncbi:MAG: hypothetical protein R3195_18240 [Gemmatimonadota bacterium]|nr:hypothetical protein [Gemmatimonadota bacterium]
MKRHFCRPSNILLAGLLVVVLGACDDPFSEFLLDVPDNPSDAMLFDFDNGRLQDPSAFDVIGNTVARPDQTTQWDFVFRVVNGAGQLFPFSLLADSVSEAGIHRSSRSFESILEAPEDGYEQDSALLIGVGDVYVVRSRRDRTQILICSQYMKMEILDIDIEAGTVMFRYLRNPNCGDKVLEPGTHGEL